MTTTRSLVTTIVLVALGAAPAGAAKEKAYPTFACASAKQNAAATYCQKTLKAWGAWEKTQDDAKRAAAIGKAGTKLGTAWTTAEAKAQKAGLDCAEGTHSATEVAALVGAPVEALVELVNDGLTLGGRGAKCGTTLLTAAGKACASLLRADATANGNILKANAVVQRTTRRDKAVAKLRKSFRKATAGSCPSTATEDAFVNATRAAHDAATYGATVSSRVDATQYGTYPANAPVSYEGRTFTAQCIDGGPYSYFVKRGTVNKLVMYYQGGGACWDQLTCGVPVCDAAVSDGDDPNNFSSGFADATNPANPFRDWSIVFVSYCSCDIHFGDAAQDYTNFDAGSPLHIEHRGFQNAKIVEKFAREHFLSPDMVFVTGSSAGAYGAWFHGPLLHDVWPGSQFAVLADAGNGVITQEFLDEFFPNWNFLGNVPPKYPEIADIIANGSGIRGYTEYVTETFPTTPWAHYAAAFDGGTGGQTGFYNVMRNGNDPPAALRWWDGSCAFNQQMRAQAIGTHDAIRAAGRDNYRYYIGTGSRHTMWGSDKVYTDTTGDVPTIVDWVNGMLASGNGSADPAWTNVECTNCGLLLDGDVRPNPLVPPFTAVGPDVVIQCAAAPSSGFGP